MVGRWLKEAVIGPEGCKDARAVVDGLEAVSWEDHGADEGMGGGLLLVLVLAGWWVGKEDRAVLAGLRLGKEGRVVSGVIAREGGLAW